MELGAKGDGGLSPDSTKMEARSAFNQASNVPTSNCCTLLHGSKVIRIEMNEMYVNSKYMRVCSSSPRHNGAPKLTFSPVNHLLLILFEFLNHVYVQTWTVAGPAALVPRYDGYVVNCRHDTVCVSVTRILVVRHVGDVIPFDVPCCTGYLHPVSPGARTTACTTWIRYRRQNTTGIKAAGSQTPCAF